MRTTLPSPYVQGIHPGSHKTWTRPVQKHHGLSVCVFHVVRLFHPSVAKAAVAAPHRPQGPEEATRVLQACMVAYAQEPSMEVAGAVGLLEASPTLLCPRLAPVCCGRACGSGLLPSRPLRNEGRTPPLGGGGG